MPAKTGAQLKAMFAAAKGKSKLGIPKKVGREFVKATPSKTKSRMMKGGMSHAFNAAMKKSMDGC